MRSRFAARYGAPTRPAPMRGGVSGYNGSFPRRAERAFPAVSIIWLFPAMVRQPRPRPRPAAAACIAVRWIRGRSPRRLDKLCIRPSERDFRRGGYDVCASTTSAEKSVISDDVGRWRTLREQVQIFTAADLRSRAASAGSVSGRHEHGRPRRTIERCGALQEMLTARTSSRRRIARGQRVSYAGEKVVVPIPGIDVRRGRRYKGPGLSETPPWCASPVVARSLGGRWRAVRPKRRQHLDPGRVWRPDDPLDRGSRKSWGFARPHTSPDITTR